MHICRPSGAVYWQGVPKQDRAYRNYKGGCLHKSLYEHGLACRRAHAQERKVVSAAADPLLQGPSRWARALRLCMYMSGLPMWTLWNQSLLTSALIQRCTKLCYIKRFQYTCPCGSAKCCTLSAVKVDASQFLKSASTSRSWDRAKVFLDDLAKKRECNHIAVKRSKKAYCIFVQKVSKCPKGFSLVSFNDILADLRFYGDDCLFTVGSEVVERIRGRLLGGAMSAPAIAVDLEHGLRLLYKNLGRVQQLGWEILGVHISKLLQGLLHVDDCLVMSKVFCQDCLYVGMQRLWPEDVGVSRESFGNEIEFLHAVVHIHDGFEDVPVIILPASQNNDFINGVDICIKKSRLVEALNCILNNNLICFSGVIFVLWFSFYGGILMIVKMWWWMQFWNQYFCNGLLIGSQNHFWF